MDTLRNRLALVVWPMLLAGLMLGMWLTPWQGWVEPLERWLADHTRIGWLVYLALYVVVVALPLPAAAMSVVGGLAFGWWGIPLALLGSLLGALGPWWATRRFLRDPVMARLGGPRVRAADAMVRDDALVFVTLLRLTPILPFTVQNYLLGLTSVRLIPFAIATIAGLAPSTVALVWIGELGSLTFTGATAGQILSLVAGLGVFAAFLAWAIWRAIARLRSAGFHA
ncbi:TVP38/TMEM64 family protein [Jannaschia sp. LMIT008]|uniref:TVP38/TMEM64 family protein n=1 Tax=Jannaschia maritima TaxID=3032585 RepID=UPI002811FC92|nr:VTT domain-containing protein [Jannaschia sp. LMIT008]